MPTFRPVSREEHVPHETALEHAFGADAGPPEYDGADDLDERIAERWGLYDDGALLSACLLYDLEATLAEGSLPIGGIGGFTTPPEHRSHGYGTRLQQAVLEEFHDRGYPYAVLWPVSIPYYREHGWGLAHLQTEYAFPPAAIEGVAGTAPDGRFERVAPAEYERLASVYEGFREEYRLALDRSAAWWQERVLGDAWAYCWTPADAETPTGYVVATLPGEHGEMTLAVDELVASDETARTALLSFVYGHLPQVEEVRWQCPEETGLLHDATDPGEVSATVEPGAMGRIVDVKAAVDALPSSRNPTTPVVLSVDDPLRSANDGTFAIEPGPSGPVATRVSDDDGDGVAAGERTTPESVDARFDVGLLSRLYAGGVDVVTLGDRYDLAVDDSTHDALDALFPSGEVYLPDFF